MTNTTYHDKRIKYADLLYENEDLLPHRYALVITNRCNLDCSFCFQERSAIPGSLTAPDWIRLIEQFPDYAHITLTGGEPLLCRGFRDIFLAATERHTCNIITNGLLLSPELIELFLSRPRFKVLSISIDDIGNHNRDVLPAKWEHMVSMLQLLHERRTAAGSDLVIDTKTVVLDKNAGDLLSIHRYCIETLHSDTHTFMLLKGHPIQYSDFMVPFESMRTPSLAYQYQKFETVVEQLELVRQYNLQYGTRGFTHPKVADLLSPLPVSAADLAYINAARFEKDRFCGCKAPWESVHVNVDGNLFPCMSIAMGNVKDTPLKEIVGGETFRRFKDVIRREGTVEGCNRCGYLLPKSTTPVVATA